MERVEAIVGGLAVVAVIFGGFIAIRTVSRLFRAMVWFAETVALFGFALVLGYLAYRIFLGSSDDPRYTS